MLVFAPEWLKNVHSCTETIHRLTALILVMVHFTTLNNILVDCNKQHSFLQLRKMHCKTGSAHLLVQTGVVPVKNASFTSQPCNLYLIPTILPFELFRWPLPDGTPSPPHWCDRCKRSGADYEEDDEEQISTCQVRSAKLSLRTQCSNLPPAEGVYVSMRVLYMHICEHAIFPTAYSCRDHPVDEKGSLNYLIK